MMSRSSIRGSFTNVISFLFVFTFFTGVSCGRAAEVFDLDVDRSTGIETITCSDYMRSDPLKEPLRLLTSIWINGYISSLDGVAYKFDLDFVSKMDALIVEECTKNEMQFVYRIIQERTKSNSKQTDQANSAEANKSTEQQLHEGRETSAGDQEERLADSSTNAAITDCDRLAASPYDLQRRAPSTHMTVLEQNAGKAIRACLDAIASSPGDPVTLFQLARAYAANDDYAQSRPYYVQAVERGHRFARYELATLYRYGKGGEKDARKAMELFMRVAEDGVAISQHAVGEMISEWEVGPPDFVKAKYWFEKAAKNGEAAALYEIGKIYEYVEGNNQKAIENYELAAQAGVTDASGKLAELYYNMSEQDPALLNWAIQHATAAALASNPTGLHIIGLAYFKGRGMVADVSESYKYFQAAANAGNKDSNVFLAYIEDRQNGNTEYALELMVEALRSGRYTAAEAISSTPQEIWSLSFRRAFQRYLKQNNSYDGAIDGIIGIGTKRAIWEHFGLEMPLGADGQIVENWD